ncbi:DUF4340 domain-containing protein [Aliikangiella sp. IMCC44359]|uniref:DUF4340 domain-containing protein n=1 Tax=Aliikangiella sp. IMCC44359 TaxID=3459125 RepID=UPI00403B1C16
MNKLKSKLSILLAVQLILIVGLFFINQQNTQQYPQEPLLKITQSDINKVVIKGENKLVAIHSENERWQLPEYNQLPANEVKVKELIEKLATLKTNWPIATTNTSHERFEVAEDKFQRHLALYKNDQLVSELYIGTSPGFRKVHARVPGKDEVYSIKLNSFDIPLASDDWLDKTLLQSKPIKIKGSDFELSQNADNWSLIKTTESQNNENKPDPEKAKQLAQAISQLNILKKVDKQLDTPSVTLDISDTSNQWRYHFFKDEDNYYVKRSDIEALFSINSNIYNKFSDVNYNSLILKDEATAEAEKKVEEPSVENLSSGEQ